MEGREGICGGGIWVFAFSPGTGPSLVTTFLVASALQRAETHTAADYGPLCTENSYDEASCGLSSAASLRSRAWRLFAASDAKLQQCSIKRFQQGRHEEGRKASTRPCLLYSKWGAKVGGGGQISCERFKMQGGPFNVNIHPASTRSRVIA